MIRCLTFAPIVHAARHIHRRHRHHLMAAALVFAPCALAGAVGYEALTHWPSVQDDGPVSIPEPTMIFVFVAAGVYAATRRSNP